MGIVLEVLTGKQAGQRLALANNKRAYVGRSTRAHLQISDDLEISQMHFSLKVEGELVRVQRVDMQGELFLNDQKVFECQSQLGDIILAGQTRFELCDESTSPRTEGQADSSAAVSLPLIVPKEELIDLNQVDLFHLGDSVLEPPTTDRNDFPPPPKPEWKKGFWSFHGEENFQPNNTNKSMFAIVDCARHADLVKQAKVSGGCDPVSLFLGDRAPQLAHVAPYFFELSYGSHHLEDWQAALGNSSGILMDCPSSAQDLYIHLRFAFIVQDETNQEFFFRFYDPRVLRTYLPTCTPEELAIFFGPVRNWICEDETGSHFVEYSRDSQGQLKTTPLGVLKAQEQPV